MLDTFQVKLKIHSAHSLVKRSFLKYPNPFVRIKADKFVYQTNAIKKTTNPEWKETFEIKLKSSDQEIQISVWDNRFGRNLSESSFLGLALAKIDFGIKTVKLAKYSQWNKTVRGYLTYEISHLEEVTNIPLLDTNAVKSNHESKSDSQPTPVFKDRSHSTSDALNCNKSSRNQLIFDLPLPVGYEKRVSKDGKVYYIDTVYGITHWYHPSIPKFLRKMSDFSCLGLLPPGWDSLVSASGRPYFIDHTSRTTQYSDPRLLQALSCPDGLKYTVNKLRAAGFKIKDQRGCSSMGGRTRHSSISNSQCHRRVSQISNNYPLHSQNHSVITEDSSTEVVNSSGYRPSKEVRSNSSAQLHTSEMSSSFYDQNNATRHIVSFSKTEYENINPFNGNADSSDNQMIVSFNLFDDAEEQECETELAPLSLQRRRISRPTSEYIIANKTAIEAKLRQLRTRLKELAQRKLCIIETSRDNIMDHSFNSVRKLRSTDMRRRLVIKFTDEEGLDYGGVAREWLYLLSETLFSCRHGLFEASGGFTDGTLLRVSSLSAINENHLRYFNFIGRIIGIAIFHGYYIDADFCRTFYQRILNMKPKLEDFIHCDVEVYKSLKWILENDIDQADLGLTFSLDQEVFGEVHTVDLCHNGRNIPVINSNKLQYVNKYVDYQLGEKCAQQYEQIRRGIFDVLPEDCFKLLKEDELEVLLTGISEIDINDWQKNTRLKHCTENDELIYWFWQVVRCYSETQRIKLLQFVTGSSRIPLSGFEGLRGSYGSEEPKLFTIKVVKNASPSSLPKAHTCFNRLDLPPYINYQNLYDKLTCAIEETCGFAVI